MKVLFLSETFPDASHPACGTYNLALCRELSRAHEVRVISPRSWLDVVRGRRFEAGDAVRESGLKVLYPTRWYTPGFAQSKYGGQMWWSIRSALRRLTHDWKPDAVLSYWAHPDGECGLRAGRMFNAPSAVIVGGSDVLLLPKDTQRGACVRRVLSESDAVITVSDGLRKACLEQTGSASRVHTIRQGVDPQVFHHGDQAEARARLGLSVPAGETLAVWVGADGRPQAGRCVDPGVSHAQGSRSTRAGLSARRWAVPGRLGTARRISRHYRSDSVRRSSRA